MTVDHRDLHVLTHSFPTRRSSDLRTQHAYRIFAIAQLRIANHADHAGLDVFQTAGEINDREITYVVIHRVDGEIATKRIGFQRAVFVVGQDAAGLVALVAGGDLAAEGRDLADLVAVAYCGNWKGVV